MTSEAAANPALVASASALDQEPVRGVRRARFYAIVALSGAVVMALEILSIRILSPTYGNSVEVWGSIISVFLAALAGGYTLGGRLADRYPSLAALGWLLLAAGAAQTVLLMGALPLTAAIGRATGSSAVGPLLAAAVLFGPTTVALATVSPFAVRLSARDLDRLGGVAGRLYALSTAGSLVGTLGCTFVLIPFVDLATILSTLLTLTALCAATAFVGERRRGARGLLLAALLVVFAMASPSITARPDRSLLARQLTPYQTLELRDRAGRRTLFSDGQLHSSIEVSSGLPALHYVRQSTAALLFGEPREALILGLGGGTLAGYLRRALPELAIDHVEVDPAVLAIAERFFGFAPGPRDRVHLRDARVFLEESTAKWDLIVCDTYVGLAIPFHLTTSEFFRLTRDRLRPGGVLLVNVAGSLSRSFPRAILATVLQAYAQVYAFRVPLSENTLVVATAAAEAVSDDELRRRASALDDRFDYDPSFSRVFAFRVDPLPEVALQEALVDEFAPVDRLLHLDRRHDRKSTARP